LRVFRFFSQTGFKIAPGILEFIKKNGALLNGVAKERINYEILKIFEGEHLIEALLKMQETGLLFEIFPPMKEVMRIPKNSHHHLDLFTHSLECIKNIKSDKPLLKLSALLHDIGKPPTWTIEEDTGRHRFIGHDKKGAQMAKKLLSDLKFSNKQIAYITKMIETIYPSALCKAKIRRKAMARFVRN
jgi:putative nucleotidyltransferase with HDIG domain